MKRLSNSVVVGLLLVFAYVGANIESDFKNFGKKTERAFQKAGSEIKKDTKKAIGTVEKPVHDVEHLIKVLESNVAALADSINKMNSKIGGAQVQTNPISVRIGFCNDSVLIAKQGIVIDLEPIIQAAVPVVNMVDKKIGSGMNNLAKSLLGMGSSFNTISALLLEIQGILKSLEVLPIPEVKQLLQKNPADLKIPVSIPLPIK